MQRFCALLRPGPRDITADLDFPRLLATLGVEGPGLILLRGGNYSEIESLDLDCVRRVLMAVAQDELARSIVVVADPTAVASCLRVGSVGFSRWGPVIGDLTGSMSHNAVWAPSTWHKSDMATARPCGFVNGTAFWALEAVSKRRTSTLVQSLPNSCGFADQTWSTGVNNGRTPRRLPNAWAGQGARMVERIFTEQTLAACFIEGDEAHDHFVRRRGLRECDGLLEGNAACPGMNGDVRHLSRSTRRSSQKQKSTRFAPLKSAARRPMSMSSSLVTVHSSISFKTRCASRAR